MSENSSYEVGPPEEPIFVNIIFNGEVAKAIETLCSVDGIDPNELVRRGVGVYAFLKKLDFSGAEILVKNPDGTMGRLVFPEDVQFIEQKVTPTKTSFLRRFGITLGLVLPKEEQ